MADTTTTVYGFVKPDPGDPAGEDLWGDKLNGNWDDVDAILDTLADALAALDPMPTGGGTDKIFYENDQTITVDYTITSGKNAMSAGPITIASGVTVTVPSGSTWTIV
jgi:hypothetical protein